MAYVSDIDYLSITGLAYISNIDYLSTIVLYLELVR
jgi:hypothetical protein